MKTTAPMLARRYVGNQPCASHRKNDAKLDELLPAPVICPKSADFLVDHRHRSDTAIRSCRNWGGAIRSTHWCDSLHPLVRFAPPTGAIRSTQPLEGSARLGRANRAAGHQPPHPCRPSSVLTSTYIGTNAEPVLSLLYLFLLLSTYGVPLAAPWSPRWLIRPSSAPKTSPAKGFSTPATTPASPSRSRPSRSRHRCRIRPLGQPRSPPPCKI